MTSIALLTRANLLLHGIACLFLGVSVLAHPATTLTRIGLGVLTAADVRTVGRIYGDLTVVLALIWLISASIRRMQRFGLLSIAVVMLTLIVAQRIGAAVGSSSSAMRLAWTAAELASLLLAVWLYRSQVEWSGVAAPKTDASPPTADK